MIIFQGGLFSTLRQAFVVLFFLQKNVVGEIHFLVESQHENILDRDMCFSTLSLNLDKYQEGGKCFGSSIYAEIMRN